MWAKIFANCFAVWDKPPNQSDEVHFTMPTSMRQVPHIVFTKLLFFCTELILRSFSWTPMRNLSPFGFKRGFLAFANKNSNKKGTCMTSGTSLKMKAARYTVFTTALLQNNPASHLDVFHFRNTWNELVILSGSILFQISFFFFFFAVVIFG